MASQERPRSDQIQKVRERRARHKQKSRPYRAAVVVAGFAVTALGVVMTGPVPGPGIVIIPIGLALLALEFVWAERLLERAIDYAEESKRKAADTSTKQRIVGGALTAAAVAAFVAAAILYDIPLLPV